MDVGYIGTGTMGNPMARCLLDAGHNVTVYDVRREATTNLCEMGAHWADSPRAVAEAAGVVFTSLPGPTEAELVVTDPDTGILAGFPRGGAWIDTTTNSPSLIRRLAEVCRQRGVEMLDSPVSGRPPAMTMMVGGDPAVFEKHRPGAGVHGPRRVLRGRHGLGLYRQAGHPVSWLLCLHRRGGGNADRRQGRH